MEKGVDLGFAEEQEKHLLTSQFFPSKIGGQPAWLDLSNEIPTAKELECEYSNEPCIFLCQVYAAGSKSHSFHRTIYVFICNNGECCKNSFAGNIKVFRSQLPLINDFYSSTPPDESNSTDLIKPQITLCKVCYCNGPLTCAKCHKVSYCSKIHQALDWKHHKKFCTKGEDGMSGCEELFPEYEIVIDREDDEEELKVENSESHRMAEYEEVVKQLESNDIPESDFNELVESKEDKTFGKFKKIIDKNPSQVLRYDRHGVPLWISKCGIKNHENIPNCGACGGRRTFEFQVMPQMLNYLKNYDLDFGIIAVYTCENDCKIEGYASEYCVKQDVLSLDDDGDEGVIEDFEKLEVNPPAVADHADKKKVDKKFKKGGDVKKVGKKAFEENEVWD